MNLDARRVWLMGALIFGVLLGDAISIVARDSSEADQLAGKKPRATATSTRKPGSSTGTGSKGTSKTPGAGAGAQTSGGILLPPAAGTYRYKTSQTDSSSGGSIKSGSQTYVFGKARKEEKFYTQTVKITTEQGKITRTNRWAVDGLYHVKDQYSKDRACTYDPPRLAVRYPLRVGDRWTQGLPNCQEGNQTTPGTTVEGSETNSVLRTESRAVGGKSVLCYVIESVTLATFDSPQGSGTSRSDMVQWFAPAYGLFVRVEQTVTSNLTSTGPAPQSRKSSSTTTTTLTSLKPT